MSGRIGRPKRVEGHDTTAAILEEAERQFTAAGYANTTNKIVASACGITGSALYHYFTNKTALYAAVADRAYGSIVEGFERSLRDVSGFRPQLDAVLDVSITLHRERPTLAAFAMGGPTEARRHPELQPIVDHHFAAFRSVFRKIVEEAQSTGDVKASTDTEVVVDTLLMILQGLADLAAQGESADRYASVVRTFGNLLDGTL